MSSYVPVLMDRGIWRHHAASASARLLLMSGETFYSALLVFQP